MEVIFVVLVCVVLVVLGFRKPKNKHQAPKRTYQAPKNAVRGRGTHPARPGVDKRSVATPLGQNHPVMPESMRLTGKAYIIDGDTIKIKGVKIRLAGIDAPELNMPWGQKSKWTMVDICKGQTIVAELDGERSHDRLVGTCFLPDGRDIGAEIIKRGLALDLPHFSGGKYRKLEPEGARRKLCNGKFGHASIRVIQHTEVRVRSNQW